MPLAAGIGDGRRVPNKPKLAEPFRDQAGTVWYRACGKGAPAAGGAYPLFRRARAERFELGSGVCSFARLLWGKSFLLDA